jgi:hypothetical protein
MKQAGQHTYQPAAHRHPRRDYRLFFPALAGWLIFVFLFFLLKHPDPAAVFHPLRLGL